MKINFTETFCIFGLLKIIVSKCPNILLSNSFLTDITNEIFQAFPANMLQDKTGNIKFLLNIVGPDIKPESAINIWRSMSVCIGWGWHWWHVSLCHDYVEYLGWERECCPARLISLLNIYSRWPTWARLNSANVKNILSEILLMICCGWDHLFHLLGGIAELSLPTVSK